MRKSQPRLNTRHSERYESPKEQRLNVKKRPDHTTKRGAGLTIRYPLIDDVEWGYKLQGEKNILSESHFVIYVFYGIPSSNSLSLSRSFSQVACLWTPQWERNRKDEEVKGKRKGIESKFSSAKKL